MIERDLSGFLYLAPLRQSDKKPGETTHDTRFNQPDEEATEQLSVVARCPVCSTQAKLRIGSNRLRCRTCGQRLAAFYPDARSVVLRAEESEETDGTPQRNGEAATYGDWLRQMGHLKGGWLGGLVIVSTLIVTPMVAYQLYLSIPEGYYWSFLPDTLLIWLSIIPAALVFLLISALLWPLKRPRS